MELYIHVLIITNEIEENPYMVIIEVINKYSQVSGTWINNKHVVHTTFLAQTSLNVILCQLSH